MVRSIQFLALLYRKNGVSNLKKTSGPYPDNIRLEAHWYNQHLCEQNCFSDMGEIDLQLEVSVIQAPADRHTFLLRSIFP